MQSSKSYPTNIDDSDRDLYHRHEAEENSEAKESSGDAEDSEAGDDSAAEAESEPEENPDPVELNEEKVHEIVELLHDYLKKRAISPQRGDQMCDHRKTCKWLKECVPDLFPSVLGQIEISLPTPSIHDMTAILWDEAGLRKHAEDWLGEGTGALVLQIATVLEDELTEDNVNAWVEVLENIFEWEADEVAVMEAEIEAEAEAEKLAIEE